jgi:hypothetical protein
MTLGGNRSGRNAALFLTVPSLNPNVSANSAAPISFSISVSFKWLYYSSDMGEAETRNKK